LPEGSGEKFKHRNSVEPGEHEKGNARVPKLTTGKGGRITNDSCEGKFLGTKFSGELQQRTITPERERDKLDSMEGCTQKKKLRYRSGIWLFFGNEEGGGMFLEGRKRK